MCNNSSIRDKTNRDVIEVVEDRSNFATILAGISICLQIGIVIILMFSSNPAKADTLDMTLGSWHINAGDKFYREFGTRGNPGAGYTYDLKKERFLTAGMYINSNDHTTVYFGGGREADYGPIGIGGTFIITSGYARTSPFKLNITTFPYLRLGYKRWPIQLRISHIPTVVSGVQVLWRADR